MTVRLLGIAMLLLSAGPVAAQSNGGPATPPEAVQSVAQEWLALLDERKFEESWEEATPFFRERIDQSQWTQRGTRLVDSLGTSARRTLTAAHRRDSLRRTAGPFIVLTYRTIRNETPLEELLVLGQNDDEWRVTGYRVSPLPAATP